MSDQTGTIVKDSRKLEKLVKERTEKLEYVTRQLSALNEVSNRFTQVRNEEELFDEVPRLLTSSLDFDRAVLILVSDNGAQTREAFNIRSLLFRKDSPEFVQNFLNRVNSPDFQIPQAFLESYRENKTIFIPDLNLDPRWPKDPGQPIRTKAVVITPIRINHQPIGLLFCNMQHHERLMDSGDVIRFEMFANMIGLALENIRAYRELEVKILERTKSLRDANRELRRKAILLAESEQSFRNLVENVNDIIYSITPEGDFSYISPNFGDILGHDPDLFLHKSFTNLVHPDDVSSCQEFLKNALKSGEKQSGLEHRLRHSDGTWHWHMSNAAPLKDSHGKTISLIGISRDITENKQMLHDLAQANGVLRETQSQLVQSEKMASLGMLVAGIAHEINTPISAIYSMHDTLLKGLEKLKSYLRPPQSDQEQRKMNTALEIIEDANRVIETGCERVTGIVKRLRSFARLDEAQLKKVNIHQGLEDTLTLISHELKHQISIFKEYGDIPEIACFPGQLNQVFLNIIVNAKQAIKGHGELRIKTYLQDDKVHISFRDNGAGIPKEHIGRLFDPGFTTKGVGVGTGLGLSICYQIIQDHKGEIRVESEPGKGSEFTIVLPTNLESKL